ncbi:unnamed protein product [Parajaminaea phylloscopi]
MSPGRDRSASATVLRASVSPAKRSANDARVVRIKRAIGEQGSTPIHSSSDELSEDDENVRSAGRRPRKKPRGLQNGRSNLGTSSEDDVTGSANGSSKRQAPILPVPLATSSHLANVATNGDPDVTSSTIEATSPSSQTHSQSPRRNVKIDPDMGRSQVTSLDEGPDRADAVHPDNGSEVEVAEDRDSPALALAEIDTLPALAEPVRDTDGFLPGSITRVALQNFVTYDYTEFSPGPHLNMIIGPNGTGKSTIVCAIALGLGWKPAVLGRAKDVASFVKQGHEAGWIEIELKGSIGEANIVIRRNIERKSNTSEFRLNGKKATQKEVTDQVAAFDISVANLCCFLPQDKVADFARMDPARLLIETERAAGDPNLSDWHERMNELSAQRRDIRSKLESEEAEHGNLEQRNQVLSHDVERYEQRRRLEDDIAQLNLLIPVTEHDVAVEDYKEKKAIRIRCRERLNRLKQINRPLEIKLADMRERRAKLESKRTRLEDTVRKANRALKRYGGDIDRLDSETQDLHSTSETLTDREKQHKALVAKLQREVKDLEAQLADEPEHADTSTIEMALREVRALMREITQRCRDCQSAIDDIGLETRSLHTTKERTLKRLQSLDSARDHKLQMLRQADPHAEKAVQWLRSNQNKFQKKVFEPVMLELSVKDDRLATYVEGCINWIQMRTFVCQTRADYDLFTRELIDRQKLRLNVSELEGGRTIQQLEQQRPYTLAEIQAMGFDDFVSNLVEAPEPILAWLFSTTGLHLVPVAYQDTVNQEQIESTRQIKKYISHGAIHTIQFSEYGRRLPQTMSRDLRPARTLSRSVNTDEKQRLEGVMRDVAAQLQAAERKVGELQEKMIAEKEKTTEHQVKEKDLEGQKVDALRSRREWEKAAIEVEQKRRRLDQELRKPSIEKERERIKNSLRMKTKERIDVVSSIHDESKKLVELRAELDVATLVELSHLSEYEAWRTYLQSKDNDYDAAKSALQDASEDYQEAKDTAARLNKQAQACLDAASDEVSDRFVAEARERTERGESPPTLAQLQEALYEKQNALDLQAGVSSGVIEAFKKRAAQIKALEESMMVKRRQLNKLEQKVQRYYDKWYPALKALVERVSHRFSAAFGRVSCAGEVRISEQGDHFEKWGIDILVKFRDEEELHLLTSQRQSGGERSLSTILYLMSLTELSRSPFSLVDEINQGMDQRAERAVHDQMVEVTCQPHASQYFLITPKLLTDLRYHEKMKVLIINNGEWLPEKLDVGAIARLALACKRKGGGDASN